MGRGAGRERGPRRCAAGNRRRRCGSGGGEREPQRCGQGGCVLAAAPPTDAPRPGRRRPRRVLQRPPSTTATACGASGAAAADRGFRGGARQRGRGPRGARGGPRAQRDAGRGAAGVRGRAHHGLHEEPAAVRQALAAAAHHAGVVQAREGVQRGGQEMGAQEGRARPGVPGALPVARPRRPRGGREPRVHHRQSQPPHGGQAPADDACGHAQGELSAQPFLLRGERCGGGPAEPRGRGAGARGSVGGDD
mmetsp:Transcript_15703/g.47829  ORF Transcript_15703/g.47829 Transcript_15703/m.47829 type:complete len:250 (+) Transcript_15703:72-821(+)